MCVKGTFDISNRRIKDGFVGMEIEVFCRKYCFKELECVKFVPAGTNFCCVHNLELTLCLPYDVKAPEMNHRRHHGFGQLGQRCRIGISMPVQSSLFEMLNNNNLN